MKSFYLNKIISGAFFVSVIFGAPIAVFADEHEGNALLQAFGEVTTTSVKTPVPTLINEPVTTSNTTEEAQINALIEQINGLLVIVAQLQEQLLRAANNPENAANVGFTRNLGIGDEGIEVQSLQSMLNLDPRTQINGFGPGSKGKESTYYGNLTADAVKKFQELYRSEILTPAGLSRGTGFFGPGTRKKLNEVILARANATVALTPKAPTTPKITAPVIPKKNTNTVESNDINATLAGGGALTLPSLSLNYEVYDGFSVGKASSYEGAPGESITIEGTQLSNGTKIHFGDTQVVGIANPNGKQLTFVIPNVVKGPYELTFSSESGEEALRIMDFAVTVENATAPEIFSISPSMGPVGTEITIRGKGFTFTNNQIEFGQHIISGVPSVDGKKLIIRVDTGPDLDLSNIGNAGAEWPLFVYLANSNGRALEPGIFVIKN